MTDEVLSRTVSYKFYPLIIRSPDNPAYIFPSDKVAQLHSDPGPQGMGRLRSFRVMPALLLLSLPCSAWERKVTAPAVFY